VARETEVAERFATWVTIHGMVSGQSPDVADDLGCLWNTGIDTGQRVRFVVYDDEDSKFVEWYGCHGISLV
jgi:hypothetical protein